MQESQPTTFTCPGQKHPISRAVHLGRLAAFYPECRQCPHRNDTATLSPRQVEQLQEVESHGRVRSLFHDEGAGGVYLNDFTPAAARGIAAAFGAMLRNQRAEPVASGQGTGASKSGIKDQKSEIENQKSEISNSQSPIPNPSVVLAGDGRPITAELTAAVGEGLRSCGCNVIDIGPATAACLAFAVNHLSAAGGILVGNPGHQPQVVGMQFWIAGPQPLSTDDGLEPVIERYQSGIDSPVRNYGELRRLQAQRHYLAAIEEHYHALRPLRVVVDSASGPQLDCFQQLAGSVACQVLPRRVASCDLSEQLRAESAHFAARIDGDGETCRVFDEQGNAIPPERLLLLLARHGSSETIIQEEGISRSVINKLEQQGLLVVCGGARRAEMAAAMCEHRATLGGGPSGRFWHSVDGVPLPDALMTVTQLLVILSRNDAPLSKVLDRDAPVGVE